MRTDFREERKWKRAVARNLAVSCAEYVASTPEERRALRVNAAIPPAAQSQPEVEEQDVSMVDDVGDDDEAIHGTDEAALPDLVDSGDFDSPPDFEEPSNDILDTVAPSAIFAMPDDDVVFELRRSPASDMLLGELPQYGPPLEVPKFELVAGPEYDPDAHWRRPAVPLSKYVEAELVLSPARCRHRAVDRW